MTIPHRDTVLIISSELDIDTTVDAIKTQCALDNTQFIYLLEDLLEKADATLKARDDVYLVRDFAVHQEVEATFERIAAHHTVTRAVPSDEFALYIAAWANDRWQLPGIDYDTALRFRDKKRMKAIAQQAGIATAREITPDDISSGCIPFPIIMKPRSLAGSVGARVLHDVSALDALALDRQDDYRDMDEKQFFLETYNPNTIYHLDAIVIDKALSFLSVGEYQGKPIDFLREEALGSLNETDDDISRVWRPFVEAIVEAFEAPDGVYHIEAFKNDDDHVELLEIAYRPGGGPIVELLQEAHGVDLRRLHVALQMGLMRSLAPHASKGGYGWIMFPKRHMSRRDLYVSHIDIPPADELPSLVSHSVLSPGELASGEFFCHSDCLATFVFHGDRQQVMLDQQRVYRTFKAALTSKRPAVH
ncbi:ATP-grasp domain-containing protein [Zymobacter palmae]|uniref:Biotin carboxylase n=1 Tax=Zymobacter palmae TaxID=33074 RepID=A0A348HFB2_9GAMM|nr:serine kinase [Zymobacter palmae]BBG30314.1 biotin carboxylase [Zymobacter palmae]